MRQRTKEIIGRLVLVTLVLLIIGGFCLGSFASGYSQGYLRGLEVMRPNYDLGVEVGYAQGKAACGKE